MTQQSGKVPEEAMLSDPIKADNTSDEPEPLAWQAKLAALILLGWTIFLAWIAFS